MNPCWLFLIIPAAAAIGAMMMGLLAGGKINALQCENARLRKGAME